MPASRPADYCLGYFEGSVYVDFDNYKQKQVRLTRISFDGYGCCNLGDDSIPMSEEDSGIFKNLIESQIADQSTFTTIIKKTLFENKDMIWEDALQQYALL